MSARRTIARRIAWVAAALACTVLALPPTSAQQARVGRALYVANGCYQCHGYDGQGGVAGPRIAPAAYPYAAFAVLVRRPANVMPAYAASVLGDDDLRAIYEYIDAVPEPPPIEDIAPLR